MKQHQKLFDVSVFSSPKIPSIDVGQIAEENQDVIDSISSFPVEESPVIFKLLLVVLLLVFYYWYKGIKHKH